MLNQYSVDNIGILELIVPTSQCTEIVQYMHIWAHLNDVYYLKQAFPLVQKWFNMQTVSHDIKMQNISKDS